MDVFSMGMFCVDEIHTENESFLNIIGGAGTYGALGAALMLFDDKKRAGFICDEGNDFTDSMKHELESWGMGIVFRKDNNRETTKAWNRFVGNEQRLFKYLSPKLQITPEDLKGDAANAKVIHLICSPERALNFINKLHAPGQKYVFEPVPTSCLPEHFELLKTVNVDVLTPNALEMAAFVGKPEPKDQEEVEAIVDLHFEFASTIAVRCGAMGCFLRAKGIRKWYKPYFTDSSHVVDPSGAGNAFTGGMGAAIAKNLDWDHCIAYGSVASSFMIQQVGPPKFSNGLWNNDDPLKRLNIYLNRSS